MQGLGKPPEELLAKFPKISATALIDFIECPEIYHWKHVLKKKEEQTPAMKEGVMIHMALLEPEEFSKKYLPANCLDGCLWTVDEIKNAITNLGEVPKGKRKDDFISQLAELNPSARFGDLEKERIEKSGLIVLTEKQTEMIEGIKNKIEKNTVIKKMIENGTKEQLGWFLDETAEVIVTFKIDYYREGVMPIAIDLKTVPSANPSTMDRWLFNSGAFIQMAIYREAMLKLVGQDPVCGILAIEKTGPYIVELYPIDFGALEAGENKFKQSLLDFKKCHANNNWPSYCEGNLRGISLPHWAFQTLEHELIGQN